MKPRWLGLLALSLLIVTAVGWAVSRPAEPSAVSIGGNTMGVTWSVKLTSRTPKDIQRPLQALLDRLDAQMSSWRADSDLSRFNQHHDTDWFPVPLELAELVNQANEISQATDGAFDVTVAPLVDLWGFGPTHRPGQIPTDAEIATARQHVGYQHLHARTSPPALRKDDPALTIDLSAIAKGYAAGRLAEAMDRIGVIDYLIAVGGEVRARGHPWPVGIELPTPDTHRILRELKLQNEAISTSGDYRNFFEHAGHRFSHEIDPRTGRPVNSPLASVSVVHPDSATADALATGLMVLGPDAGYVKAVKLGWAAIFVVRRDGHFDVLTTPAFDRLHLRR